MDAAGARRYGRAVMSASHETPTDDHATHPHPPMPAVHDEAADTPAWVPASGLALLIVMVLFVVMRAALAPPPPPAAVTDEPHAAEGVVVAPVDPQ